MVVVVNGSQLPKSQSHREIEESCLSQRVGGKGHLSVTVWKDCRNTWVVVTVQSWLCVSEAEYAQILGICGKHILKHIIP